MVKMKKNRLFWVIYPSYLIVIFVCVALGSIYSFTSLKSFFYSQVENTLYEKTDLFAPYLKKELANQAPDSAIDTMCVDAGTRANVRFTVTDSSGKVIGDTEEDPGEMENHKTRPEIRSAYSGKPDSQIRYSETLEESMMYAAVPVYKDGSITAVLRSAVSVDFINKQLWLTNWGIITGGLLIAAFATLISFFFSLKISRPVTEITQGAKDFARGRLGAKLYSPDIEELGELADTLNKMAEELNQRLKTESRNKNELETVFYSMQEGVLAIDNDQKIMRLNQSALRILSMDIRDIKKKNVYELIRDSDLYKFIDKSVNSDKLVSSDLNYGSEKEKILNVRSSPLQDENDKRIGTLFVLQDVTRVRHLENMRSDFVANVSHELKTPMTAIKGFVETIREGGSLEPDKLDRFLSIIDKNVDRLINIINDLLDLSWIEKNEDTELIKFREEDVYKLTESAVKICEPFSIKKNIEIEIDMDSHIKLKANKVLLENALTNLIDNAVKYSNEGSRVIVTAKDAEKYVMISVADKGIGIPVFEQQRVFERFYRVDKGRSRKMGGTGLGLAIVKHVLNIHKGTIEIESTPGSGSCFTLKLPKNP
ncbi:MAG: HAMP domain-containing sensor histidine kinase [Thermodesulfobacteriota bacterium]